MKKRSSAYTELRAQGTPANHALVADKLLQHVGITKEGTYGSKSVSITLSIDAVATPEFTCPRPLGISLVRVPYTRDDAWARFGQSSIGTFSNKKREGAVVVWPPHLRTKLGEWFQPATTEKEWATLLRVQGYGKAEAAELAKTNVHRDLRRALTFARKPTAGCWWYETLRVSIRARGPHKVLLETEVPGIESDVDDLYILSIVSNLLQGWVNEALRQEGDGSG